LYVVGSGLLCCPILLELWGSMEDNGLIQSVSSSILTGIVVLSSVVGSVEGLWVPGTIISLVVVVARLGLLRLLRDGSPIRVSLVIV